MWKVSNVLIIIQVRSNQICFPTKGIDASIICGVSYSNYNGQQVALGII